MFKVYPFNRDMSIVGYNPEVDLRPVSQSGVLDVRKAFESGVVDGDVSIIDSTHNGVQDPSVLLPRPKDPFERMRQADYVKSVLKASKTESETVTPEGETN